MSALMPDNSVLDYLMGELSPAERARFESALAADETLRRELDETARTLELASRALRPEEGLELTPGQREKILKAATPPSSGPRWPWRAFRLLAPIGAVGLLVFSFSGVTVMKKFKESKSQAVKLQIAAYQQALQAYYLERGRYPGTEAGLRAVLPYFGKRELVVDPWGHPYRYRCDDRQNYSLSSDGPDGVPDTSDDIRIE